MEFKISKNCSNCLKFLSAILIVLHHYSQDIFRTWTSEVYKGLEYYFIYTFHIEAGFIGVAIFFFLSGYGLMESEKSRHLTTGLFLKKRLSRVYLPVLLVTALWLPLYYFVFSINGLSLSQIIYDLFWGFQDGAMWFIKVLIFLYLSFALFILFLYKNKRAAFATFIFSIIVISIITRYWKGSFAMVSIPLFFVGVFSSYYNNKYIGKVSVSLIPLLVSFLAVALYLLIDFGRQKIDTVICVGVAYFVVFAIIIFFSKREFDIIFPTILGVISFDLYLVHNKVLKIMLSQGTYCPLWLYLTSTIVVTLCFYYLHRLLDKKIGAK